MTADDRSAGRLARRETGTDQRAKPANPVASQSAAGLLHAPLQRLLEGRGWQAVRVGTDLALLGLAVVAAIVGAPAAGVEPDDASIVWLLPLLTVALLAARGDYRTRLQVTLLDSIVRMIGAVSLVAISLIALESFGAPDPRSTPLIARAWLFAVAYVASGRVLLGLTQRRAYSNRLVGRPTLIVGAGRIGAQVERRLTLQPELGLRPVGYLDADPAPSELVPARCAPILGAPADLGRVAEQNGVLNVILAFTSTPDAVLLPLVRECEDRGLQLSLVPRLFDSVNTRVELEHMGGLPLYGLRAVGSRRCELAVKTALGKSIAAGLLVLLSPLVLGVALAVKLTSPGPVIFRQRRVGRDGHQFELLKFRSMRVDAAAAGEEAEEIRAWEVDSPEVTAPGGPVPEHRLTPIGGFLRRTSLDELPQLWNVLRGDMTLVGPRPERPEFVQLFGSSIQRYDDRHRVQAGITGWAQVHGLRGKTSVADRVEWDNYYIQNWSMWLDLKVLLMTVVAVLRRSE